MHGKARAQAEAVAPADDLSHDGVRVGRLRRRDERLDLRLVVDAFAEGIGPERPELTGRRRRPVRINLRRDVHEDGGQVPKDSRKRG